MAVFLFEAWIHTMIKTTNITWPMRTFTIGKHRQVAKTLLLIWRHRCGSTAEAPIGWFSMMTSSNGNIFRVTGPLCGEFTGPGEFPTQRPVTQSFGVFFGLCLNKRLSKQPWGWWFETPSWSLWRQGNARNLKAYDFSSFWFSKRNLSNQDPSIYEPGTRYHFVCGHSAQLKVKHLSFKFSKAINALV